MLYSILSYLDKAAAVYNDRTVYTDGADEISFAQLKKTAESIGTSSHRSAEDVSRISLPSRMSFS